MTKKPQPTKPQICPKGADVRQSARSHCFPQTGRIALPENRIAGNMRTERFVPFWSKGSDSFLSVPPNADLLILENGVLRQTVSVHRNPVLDGTDFCYTVKNIAGHMPVLGDDHRHHRNAAHTTFGGRCRSSRISSGCSLPGSLSLRYCDCRWNPATIKRLGFGGIKAHGDVQVPALG